MNLLLNPVWFWGTLALAAVVLVVARYTEGRHFNPVTPLRLWVFTWLLPIVMCQVAWPLNRPWSDGAQLSVLISIVSLLAGYAMTTLATTAMSGMLAAGPRVRSAYIPPPNIRFLNECAIFLFIAAAASFGVMAAVNGGIPLLEGDNVRIAFQEKTGALWRVFILTNVAAAICGGLMVTRSLWQINKILLALAFVIALLSAWKSVLIALAIFSFTPLFLYVRLPFRTYLLSAFGVVFLFFFINSLRIGGLEAAVTFVYYIIMPFVNFDLTQAQVTEFEPGLYLANGLLKLIMPPLAPGSPDQVMAVTTWNVPGYLTHAYADSGNFGIATISALLGILGRASYASLISSRQINLTTLFLYGIYVNFAVMMHNGYLLESASVYIWILAIAIVVQISRVRRSALRAAPHQGPA